jgi:predicted nuclease of restriction endonuclease-like (RecB) superfamily
MVVKKKQLISKTPLRKSTLFDKVAFHIESARSNVQQSVDAQMVKAYWSIGKEIVEEEQKGKSRSGYGQALIAAISKQLTKQYGRGFSEANIKNMRQFYLEYPPNSPSLIRYTSRSELSNMPEFSLNLSWSHYRLLMRVQRSEARKFYQVEAVKNRWSSRELERQINSLLFERLLKSKDKKGLMRLANKGHEVLSPEDAIKDPVILEFLGIPESNRLVESKLEDAIISNLYQFLLELGKGFAFVARQQRLTLDGDHYYADLVFYHVVLKCYVVIDIKTRKLTHADLGQMQLYVNYYDEEVVTQGDNPTIGLVLCTQKSDAMVKYMLGKQTKRIFASKYQFHLPTEKELEAELKREIKQVKYKLGKN